MNRMYRNNIDGLCGNDDCGQMSAWYIFSAMGFYPVCPGSGEYILGAPYLPYMKINFENGRTLEIKAPKVSDRNRYVRSVSLRPDTRRRPPRVRDERPALKGKHKTGRQMKPACCYNFIFARYIMPSRSITAA